MGACYVATSLPREQDGTLSEQEMGVLVLPQIHGSKCFGRLVLGEPRSLDFAPKYDEDDIIPA